MRRKQLTFVIPPVFQAETNANSENNLPDYISLSVNDELNGVLVGLIVNLGHSYVLSLHFNEGVSFNSAVQTFDKMTAEEYCIIETYCDFFLKECFRARRDLRAPLGDLNRLKQLRSDGLLVGPEQIYTN